MQGQQILLSCWRRWVWGGLGVGQGSGCWDRGQVTVSHNWVTDLTPVPTPCLFLTHLSLDLRLEQIPLILIVNEILRTFLTCNIIMSYDILIRVKIIEYTKIRCELHKRFVCRLIICSCLIRMARLDCYSVIIEIGRASCRERV